MSWWAVRMAGVVIALIVSTACGSGTAGQPKAVGGTIEEFAMGITSLASLDVAKAYTTESVPTQAVVTEPLEYSDLSGGFTSNLAESVEATPTSIVYTLREGIEFSDGTPLTIGDVVWSLERLIDDEASTKAWLAGVAAVAATGEREVTVTLSKADPSMRTALTYVGHIMSRAFAEANAEDLGTAAAMPVGTGPYKYTSYTASRVEMDRNPNYWGEKPAPDRLAFDIIPEDTQRQLALRSGSIQGGKVVDIGKLSEWASIPGVAVETSPALRLNYLSFDVTQPPFDDVHMRRMVAYSLDREGVMKSAYGEAADLMPVFTPKEALYGTAPSQEEADNFLASVPTYSFDMDKAAMELARSKHPDGLDFEVYFLNEYPWSRLAALNLQENLAPLGVNVKPTVIAYDKYISDVYAGGPPSPGAAESSYPAPSATRIHSNLEGAFNVAKYDTREVTKIMPDLFSSNPAAQWEAVTKILTKIAEDAPYIPLFQPQRGFALAEGLTFTKDLDPLIFESGQWIHFLSKAG